MLNLYCYFHMIDWLSLRPRFRYLLICWFIVIAVSQLDIDTNQVETSLIKQCMSN